MHQILKEIHTLKTQKEYILDLEGRSLKTVSDCTPVTIMQE